MLCISRVPQDPNQINSDAFWAMLAVLQAYRSVVHRPLRLHDFASLKSAHQALFPIDYEDSFFHSAVSHGDGIISAAATQRYTVRASYCSSPTSAMSAVMLQRVAIHSGTAAPQCCLMG